MSEFTSTGVQTKTLDEWYQAVVAFKQQVWGNDFVLDPTTKQGADMVQLAELLYNAEMNNVSAFAQLNINTATGICLDYIGFVRGVSRNAGFPQEIKVDITSAITGYYIPANLVFRTTSGYSYYCPASVQVTNLNQQVTLLYTSDGNPEVTDGEALTTVSQFPNITSAVIAQGGVIQGQDTESDESYRARIKNSTISYIGTLEYIDAEIRKVDGVSKLNYYYNDTSSTDAKGIPAYASEFLVVPQDGVDDTTFNNAIAQKICEIKLPGAPLYGNTTVNVLDFYGEDKVIKFTRPVKKNIEIYAHVIPNPVTGQIDISGLPIVKKALCDYVNALAVGVNVSWSRVIGIIASDTGYIVDEWGMRLDGSSTWITTDLTIGLREFAWLEEADIDITLSQQ